jgi:hypothetical protein
MELLARCRDLALPFYSDLLRSSQSTLRERLFEQSERSASNADQRIFYDAIQVLSRRGDAAQAAFDAQLQRGYQQFLAGRDDEPAPSLASGNLALVAREQLEDELAVSTIVSRAIGQNAEAMWKLNRRLAALRGGRKVSDEGNPFGPARVGEALRAAMAEIDCDQKARIFIYKYLGRLLLGSFGKILQRLNDLLVQGGVLPNLKFAISKAADELDGDEVQTPDDSAEEAAAAAQQHQLLTSVMSELRARNVDPDGRRQTLGGVDYAGLQAARDGSASNFAPMDYALALSALQQAPEFSSGAALQRPLQIDAVEERLFGQLKKLASSDARHTLGQRDADTVDLVGGIFRYMLDDARIPDVVKSLLSHLHTPYLKLALIDPSLLDDQQHVARRLLNRLADAAVRWVGDEHDRVVLPKIRETVETLLRDFVDDTSIFAQLLEEFDRSLAMVRRRAEIAERRNRESQEGLEKLTVARQRAQQEVSRRIAGGNLPEQIRQLLEKPWTDFLAFNYLRNGDESLSWKAALKVVDGVMWSLQGDAGRSRDELQRHQQQLEKSITEGLRTIGYGSDAALELLSALREAQELAFAGAVAAERPATLAERQPSAPSQPPPAPEPVPQPVLSEGEQVWAARLRDAMEFGTWFEFDRPGQKPVRLKLAWFSRVSLHYMFVNQSGVKQRVESLMDLARGLDRGSVRLVQVERRSFMERALSALLSKLRRS